MSTQTMARRILVVGNAHQGNLEASYEAAFRQLGCEVEVFNLTCAVDNYARLGRAGRVFNRFVPVEAWVRKANRELIVKAVETRPRLVLVIGSQDVRAGGLAQLKIATGALLALVWPDSLLSMADSMVSCLPTFDLVGAYGREMLPGLTQLGARRAEWLPLAGDPELHAPVVVTEREREIYGADVTFIGGWRPEREDVLRALMGENLKIWGPLWDRECADKELVRRHWQGRALRGVEFAKAVLASKVNLNVIEQTNPTAPNMRFFEVPVCGGLQLVSACPEMAQEYRHGEHLFYFNERAEVRAALLPLLADERRRALVAAAGHRITLARHTYRHRAAVVLSALGG